jgi:glycosyltransferase involved in cell wall biosynthesis
VRSLRKPSVLAAAQLVGRYVRTHGIRLVHTFDVPATLFGVPAARFLSRAVVLSSMRAHRELTPGFTRTLLRVTDRLVDGIVVNCNAVRRDLIEADQTDAAKIYLCYNGIDTEEFSPANTAKPESLKDATLVIGVVCALRPEKDLGTLIDAFSEIRGSVRLKLAIVGSGPCLSELQARAASHGIDADCVFEPATRNVQGWLRSMDVFVLPSRSEALSNSLMEAMACGCAVVASRVGGNVELVDGERTGLLFESGNVADLAGALRRLVQQPALRTSLGDAAARLMRERFSLASAARRMGEIYSTALAASDVRTIP